MSHDLHRNSDKQRWKRDIFLIIARWLCILVRRYIINNFYRCLSLSPLLEECRDQKLRESLWDLSSQFHWSPQRKLHHLCQDQVSFSSSGSGPGSPRQPLPGTWGRGDSVFAAKKDKMSILDPQRFNCGTSSYKDKVKRNWPLDSLKLWQQLAIKETSCRLQGGQKDTTKHKKKLIIHNIMWSK